ncbi:MAG: acylphosphatase [Acidobacteriota bacterium]
MDATDARAAWRITGRVQGVGFRYFVARRAQILGVHGWARNLSDGSVEVQGRGTPDALAALERALAEGPPHSRVDRVIALAPSGSLERASSFTIESEFGWT